MRSVVPVASANLFSVRVDDMAWPPSIRTMAAICCCDPDSCTLGSLDNLWLELRCPRCKRVTLPPLKLLARTYGRNKLLRDITRRYVCGHCGAKPSGIHLQQSPTHGASGMGDVDHGWRVRIK